eukprot:scaffold388_cov380-Prasinococcus_capsulatus_cf.AAC.27
MVLHMRCVQAQCNRIEEQIGRQGCVEGHGREKNLQQLTIGQLRAPHIEEASRVWIEEQMDARLGGIQRELERKLQTQLQSKWNCTALNSGSSARQSSAAGNALRKERPTGDQQRRAAALLKAAQESTERIVAEAIEQADGRTRRMLESQVILMQNAIQDATNTALQVHSPRTPQYNAIPRHLVKATPMGAGLMWA